jgi:UDP-N-acetylglucosamine 2-epimerase
MTRICIVTSHRAERGLLQPLIDRIDAHPRFDLDLFSLNTTEDFGVNYQQAQFHFMDPDERPDIVLFPCDRAEALSGALAAFELSIPIMHFHAGDVGTVSKDEMYRHAISLMASVHLCNGQKAKKVVTDLLQAVGRPVGCVYDVGSTMLDDVEIDETVVPNKPYDLILYHPPTNDPVLINRELNEIESLLDPGVPVHWCYPNGDPGSEIIIERIESFEKMLWKSHNLPRPYFLGLMKNCRYFIGNSSSMVCEAPMWLSPEQIIHIGDRNKNRSFDEINPGATDRILGILEVIAGEQI